MVATHGKYLNQQKNRPNVTQGSMGRAMSRDKGSSWIREKTKTRDSIVNY